jgi:hypothetical protein
MEEYAMFFVGVLPVLIASGLNIHETTFPLLSFVASIASLVIETKARCTCVKDSRLIALASDCVRHTE